MFSSEAPHDDSDLPATVSTLHAEMWRKAVQLRPVLAARAAECEAIGKAPAATMDALKELGLTRLTQPGRYGGHELGWDAVCDVGRVLSRGCASQSWVNNIMNDHAQQLGTFAAEAQQDVWGRDPKALVCGSIEPTARGLNQPGGGVKLTGRHGFGSGVDHAQWVVCGGFRYDGDKQTGRAMFLVPVSDIEVLDDWRVFGLGGTGSKTYLVKDVLVPEHRILNATALETNPGPGAAFNKAAIFRLPRASAASSAFASMATGIAQRCLDAWLDVAAQRKPRAGAPVVPSSAPFMAGQCAAEIDAARRLAVDPVRDLMRLLERGEVPSAAMLRETKLAACYAAQLAKGAVQRLAANAGSRALFDGHPIQQALRDAMMATSHFSLNWEAASAAWTAAALAEREQK